MRLLRIWPDDTHFDFMRFRRFSLPVLGAACRSLTVVLFLTIGLNFGIDFKGGTLMELQAQVRQGRCRQAVRRGRECLRLRRSRGAGIRQRGRRFAALRRSSPAARRRRAPWCRRRASAFGNDYEFRRVETVGPRVSGELVQSGTIGVMLSILGRAALSLVPLRARARRRRHHRHPARHRADPRLLRDHAATSST